MECCCKIILLTMTDNISHDLLIINCYFIVILDLVDGKYIYTKNLFDVYHSIFSLPYSLLEHSWQLKE